jgi:hypothetical protein
MKPLEQFLSDAKLQRLAIKSEIGIILNESSYSFLTLRLYENRSDNVRSGGRLYQVRHG